MFIEYSNADQALEAVKLLNGYKFDKNHTLVVNLLTDFEKYDDILENWETPVPQPYKEQGCLQYYLLDPDACDQFSIVYEQGDKVGIYSSTQPEPTLLEERSVSWKKLMFDILLNLTTARFIAEVDWNTGSVVTFGYLHFHLPRQRNCSVGRWKVLADNEI